MRAMLRAAIAACLISLVVLLRWSAAEPPAGQEPPASA